MKYIECSGTPRELGRQYGEADREDILQNLEYFRPWFRSQTVPAVRRILARHAPEILEEMLGLSEGASAPLEEIIAMNHLAPGDECTPVMLRNSPDGIIVAKNNDSLPQEHLPFVIRKGVPEDGLNFLQLTYAGWLSGLDMMNSAGLANTHGSVGSRFPRPSGGLDIRLRAYQLMRRCRTVEEFYHGLQEIPLCGKGFSIAVGDRQRNCAFLDAAVPLVVMRSRNADFSYSVNLYETPVLQNADGRDPERRKICEYRRGYLHWLEQTAMPSSLEDIRRLLSCHEPWAPCRHGGPHHSVTDWSVICLPENGKVLIAAGAPCRNDYKEFIL